MVKFTTFSEFCQKTEGSATPLYPDLIQSISEYFELMWSERTIAHDGELYETVGNQDLERFAARDNGAAVVPVIGIRALIA